MGGVVRSTSAIHDIDSILEYIGDRSGSLSVVEKLSKELETKLQQYARQPQMGTLCEGLIECMRCFTFKSNYVVFYREIDQGIDVLRVLHGARDIDVTDFF